MHLLRKYDVAPLRVAMMRCLPLCARRHTSLGVAVIIGFSLHHLPRQTSFKKRTFVGRQKCVFCWWEMVDSDHRSEDATDLQSAPFGHSGNLPYEVHLMWTFLELVNGVEPSTC